MKPYIKLIKNTWIKDAGWGNGYVVIPKDHPFWGAPYECLPIGYIHGGLTYSEPEDNGHEGWCVGFDTCHYGDTKENWTRDRVLQEANKLLKEMIQIGVEYRQEEADAIVAKYHTDHQYEDERRYDESL